MPRWSRPAPATRRTARRATAPYRSPRRRRAVRSGRAAAARDDAPGTRRRRRHDRHRELGVPGGTCGRHHARRRLHDLAGGTLAAAQARRGLTTTSKLAGAGRAEDDRAMDWDPALAQFRAYLAVERAYSPRTVEAYLRD